MSQCKDLTIKYSSKPPRLTKKLKERIVNHQDIKSLGVDIEVFPGSWLTDCPLCGEEDSVGVVELSYTITSYNGVTKRVEKELVRLGSHTCFGGRICHKCDESIERQKMKPVKSTTEKQHDRDYKKFLNGDLYPEIKVEHRPENGMVAKARIRTNRIYAQG